MEHDFESGVEEVLARGRGQRDYKFTNWSTTYSCTPDLYFEPETIEDIREVSLWLPSWLSPLTMGVFKTEISGQVRSLVYLEFSFAKLIVFLLFCCFVDSSSGCKVT